MTDMSPDNRKIIDKRNIPADYAYLAEVIENLPDRTHCEALIPLLKKAIESFRDSRRELTQTQDAVSELRLELKFVSFDIEATGRERDEAIERYNRKREESD